MRRTFSTLFCLLSSTALAQVPLSSLPSGGAVSNTDLFYDVQSVGVGGVKVTGTQLATYIFGKVNSGCSATSSGTFTCNLITGTTLVTGTANGILFDSSGVLQNNGPVISAACSPTTSGQWCIGASSSGGAILIGQGSTYDTQLQNHSATTVVAIPTGTGHLTVGSGTPTAGTCTGFTAVTGSTDLIGRITFSSATSCTMTFAGAFTNAPFCSLTPGTALSTVEAVTTTTGLTATFGSAQTSMTYICFGA